MPPSIKLEAVLAAMSDAIVISDKEGLFIDFNEAFARLNRFESKDACILALPDYSEHFRVTTCDGMLVPPDDWPIPRALRGESGVNVELHVERTDIKKSWIGSFNFAPILVEDGSIAGAVLAGRDVTEVRRAEEHLKNISSRLHLALSSARLGVWEWDIQRNRVTWDDRMLELYGISREDFSMDVEAWRRPLHPDDRERTLEVLRASLAGEQEYETEFRVVHPNSRIVYIKANAVVLRSGDGKAERMLGVNADITEEKLAQENLQRAYAEVEAKVVERTAQLEAAKVAAENASKAKDIFLATLSHELRSPLSAILSWTQLMERGMLPPEKMQMGIRTIKESVWAQNQLIGDLLDLSRIGTGKLVIDRQPTPVGEVLKAAIESIRPTAEQRGLALEEDIPPREVYVSADPARLKQSFWNILSNAVKFTSSGGRIHVALSCCEQAGEQKVKVAIRDTGKGIKPEFLPHIFERFSQADPSSSRVHGGMGLGLSLVKSLVELQDGRVTAESLGEGKGATFTLEFPVIARGELPIPMHVAVNHRHLSSQPLQNLKVLLVEDGDETRQALAQLLAAQGALVQAAESAREALSVFQGFAPDVIVSDIAMPQEDGHSLMRKIRSLGHEKGGDTPAVALTAYADPRDREQAFTSGFQEYLSKPVDVGTLANTIVKLQRSKHREAPPG